MIWLREQQFDHPAHQIVLQEMIEALRVSKERVERLEKAIEEFLPNWLLGHVVQALRALRGVDLIVAVTFVTEIGDVRRFESARQRLGYLGLVPSERSTGGYVQRGPITKAGNGRVRHLLVESAWTYAIRRALTGRSFISWKRCRRAFRRSPSRRRAE